MEYIKESIAPTASSNKAVKRSDLKVGDEVMTFGYHDDVDLNVKIGKILKMGEYGNLLIEFNESFDKMLHAGHNNCGKAKQCFYVPLQNIRTNDKSKFEEIIKKEQAYHSNEAEWWFINRGRKVSEEL